MTPSPDPHWVRATVDEYEGPLVRYAVRFTRDLERARDVVQDTFLKLCGQDPASLEGHLTEWLYTVCRNGALDVRRKEKRMTPTTEVGTHQSAGRQSDPVAVLEQQETVGVILKLLDTLPESQQEVLRLKFQAGLSYREIGEITQRTVNHVGVLIHNGVKALRHKMGTVPRAVPGA